MSNIARHVGTAVRTAVVRAVYGTIAADRSTAGRRPTKRSPSVLRGVALTVTSAADIALVVP
jgi:hypothetical protein